MPMLHAIALGGLYAMIDTIKTLCYLFITFP